MFCRFCGKKQTAPPAKKTKTRGNGTGTAYKLPSGKWRVEYTLKYVVRKDGTKKRVCRTKSGFKTKKEALDYIPFLSGLKEAKSRMTIAEAYKAIQPKIEKLHPKRQKIYESAYKHIEHIEACNIDALSIADLQAVIDDVDGGYYSKRYVKDIFSKLYNYAFADGKIDRNLAPYIELPKNNGAKEKAIFTSDEISRLWGAWDAGEEMAGYILILIYCGLRTGELWSIRSESIDFDRRVMFGGIKTDMGKNAPIFIIPAIESVIKHFAGKNPDKTLYVGYSIDFYKKWREFKKIMGLREELSPYSGRHSCASALARAGLPEAVIMSIMRHEKYDTTLKYTHIDTENILEKMNEAMKNLYCNTSSNRT
jgi:integrase